MIKTVILLFLTALFWGVAPIIEKIGLSKTTPLLGVIIRSLAVSFSMVIYFVLTSDFKDIVTLNLKTILLFSFSGLLAGGIGMITYFKALDVAPTSKVVPIVAAYPLITALLSILILGEKVTFLRILGITFIVTGIWLVK